MYMLQHNSNYKISGFRANHQLYELKQWSNYVRMKCVDCKNSGISMFKIFLTFENNKHMLQYN